jgi:hypothetical protein
MNAPTDKPLLLCPLNGRDAVQAKRDVNAMHSRPPRQRQSRWPNNSAGQPKTTAHPPAISSSTPHPGAAHRPPIRQPMDGRLPSRPLPSHWTPFHAGSQRRAPGAESTPRTRIDATLIDDFFIDFRPQLIRFFCVCCGAGCVRTEGQGRRLFDDAVKMVAGRQ